MTALNVNVFTDVGVKDVDDELLLKFLPQQNIPLCLHVVFVGSDGVSAVEALAHWVRTYESNVLSKLTRGSSINYTILNEFKNGLRECDYCLQISPLDGYDGSNLVVKEKYVFAGDFITPEGARPSFNRVGSDAILKKFHDEGKLVDIPSAHMVKMRFNTDLLSKFDGPFTDSIVFTAFLLIFARMAPDHGANKFAEGLINPFVGRGANYSSVMKMRLKFNLGDFPFEHPRLKEAVGDVQAMYDRHLDQCKVAAEKYCSDLEANGVTLKDKEGTIKCLSEMNMVLQNISDFAVISEGALPGSWLFPSSPPQHVDIFAHGSVYVSDFKRNKIPSTLLTPWKEFKRNSSRLTDCFNPVYDLFAGYVLTGFMKGENRVNHSPDEFLKNICSEF